MNLTSIVYMLHFVIKKVHVKFHFGHMGLETP